MVYNLFVPIAYKSYIDILVLYDINYSPYKFSKFIRYRLLILLFHTFQAVKGIILYFSLPFFILTLFTHGDRY